MHCMSINMVCGVQGVLTCTMLTCGLLAPAILNVLSAAHQDCKYCESFKRRSNDRLGPSYARFLPTCDTNRATAVIFTNTSCSLTDGTNGSMQFAGGTFRAEEIEEAGIIEYYTPTNALIIHMY